VQQEVEVPALASVVVLQAKLASVVLALQARRVPLAVGLQARLAPLAVPLQAELAAKCLAWLKRCLGWNRARACVSKPFPAWETLSSRERALPLRRTSPLEGNAHRRPRPE